jgi:hypothetical protein
LTHVLAVKPYIVIGRISLAMRVAMIVLQLARRIVRRTVQEQRRREGNMIGYTRQVIQPVETVLQ